MALNIFVSELRTLMPEILSVPVEVAIKFYPTANNYLDAFIDYVSELGHALDYDFTNSNVDLPAARAGFYTKLHNDKFNIAQLSVQNKIITIDGKKTLEIPFVVYWLDRFRKENNKIQQIVLDELGMESLYGHWSEDVGLLTRYQFAYNSSTIFKGVPYDTDSNTFNKISQTAKENFLYGSNRCHETYCLNFKNLYSLADPKTTHGGNLVLDSYHLDRANEIAVEGIKLLIQHFDWMWPIFKSLYYYNPQDLTNNKKKMEKIAFMQYNMEYIDVKVDLLQKKLKTKMKELTTYDILSYELDNEQTPDLDFKPLK